MTHDKYDNYILKPLTRIANALDRIAKRLPEECDTAEYAKEHPDWAEKVKKMASGEYVRVIRCKDCRCFIPLEDMQMAYVQILINGFTQVISVVMLETRIKNMFLNE